MNCMNCGSYLKPDADKCDKCGALAVDDTILHVKLRPRETALSVMKSPMYFILAVLWAVSFILGVVCVFGYHSRVAEFMTARGFGSFGVILMYLGVGAAMAFKAAGVFLSAKNASKGNGYGFKYAKYGVYTSFWVMVAAAVILLLGAFTLFLRVLFFDSYSIFGINMLESEGLGVQLVFWMLVAAAVVLSLFGIKFYKRLTEAFETVLCAVETNKCVKRVSTSAYVMCFIWAAVPLFAAISVMNGESTGMGIFALFLISVCISFLLTGVNVMAFGKIRIYSEREQEEKKAVFDDNSMPISISKSATVRYCRYCGRILVSSDECVCGGKKAEDEKIERPESRLIYSGADKTVYSDGASAETDMKKIESPSLKPEEKSEDGQNSENYFFRQDEL